MLVPSPVSLTLTFQSRTNVASGGDTSTCIKEYLHEQTILPKGAKYIGAHTHVTMVCLN